MDKKVIITIPQFGAPQVEAVGFNGVGCVDATSVFEKALNSAGVESRDFKPEWALPSDTTEGEEEKIQW